MSTFDLREIVSFDVYPDDLPAEANEWNESSECAEDAEWMNESADTSSIAPVDSVNVEGLGVDDLRTLLAPHLVAVDRMKELAGLPTGIAPLDQFLLWRGLPKDGLSLFQGPLGAGATSLWLEAARKVTQAQKWVAWVQCTSDGLAPLSPLPLTQSGLDLGRLICFECHQDEKKLLWLLQELLSSSLFELIGCDVGAGWSEIQPPVRSDKKLKAKNDGWPFREYQIRQLQTQARNAQAALVFLATAPRYRSLSGSIASVFSLIVSFEKKHLRIDRALHRPTPRTFARSLNYARFTFHTADRLGFSSYSDSANHTRGRATEPHPLPEAAGAAGDGLPPSV